MRLMQFVSFTSEKYGVFNILEYAWELWGVHLRSAFTDLLVHSLYI